MEPILEKIKLGEKQSILAFKYKGDYFDAPWHFHPQHELTYIEDSVGTKFIGDYVGSYQPGELVLLRSNLPHCWKNTIEEGRKATSWVIQWNKAVFSKVPELESVFELLKRASHGIQFHKSDVSKLLPKVKKIHASEGSEVYLNLLDLLTDLAKCNYKTLSEASFTDDLPTEFGNRMAKIHEFVDANYNRKIKLSELASLTNMSEQSFSRFFSQIMGRPFFTFLNEYRINMASRMLIDTDWTVLEIGYKCGYESPPFFHKQFKKFKENSPNKYRKQHQLGG